MCGHIAAMEFSPHTIKFETGNGEEQEALFTIDTHPSSDIIATGDITGQINLYSFAAGQACTLLRSFSHLEDKSSCRVLKFSSKGNRLFGGTGNRDVTSTDVESGQLLRYIDNAHSAALYSMLAVSEGVLVSADEKGEIKIWDTRTWKVSSCLRESRDFISSMVVDNDKRTLVATSGDGRLYAFDLRQRKLEQCSDCNESELLSLAIIKGGKKLVCGDGCGTLMIYNWGLWGDITDRFPSHPQSVDSLIALNDSVVCTGCMDGTIRSLQILPNQALGIVGQQSTTAFCIDTMCLTHDHEFLVTSSSDCCKFWPVGAIPTLPSDKEPDKKKKRAMVDREKPCTRKKKRKQKKDSGDTVDVDFFADL